jgi:hypothetical protein
MAVMLFITPVAKRKNFVQAGCRLQTDHATQLIPVGGLNPEQLLNAPVVWHELLLLRRMMTAIRCRAMSAVSHSISNETHIYPSHLFVCRNDNLFCDATN